MVYQDGVMDVMKILRIPLQAQYLPTSLAFWASVQTITPTSLPDVTSVHMPTVCVASCLRGQCILLHWVLPSDSEYSCGSYSAAHWVSSAQAH